MEEFDLHFKLFLDFSPDSASADPDPDEERRTIVAKYKRVSGAESGKWSRGG